MTMSMDRPIARRRFSRNRIRWIAAAAVLAVLAIWSRSLLTAPPTMAVRAQGLVIGQVRQAVFEDAIPLRGSVVPLETIFLDAVEGGRVEKVLTEAGEKVVAGQPILELSNTALQLEVIQREALVIQQINAIYDSRRSVELTQASNARQIAEAEWNIKRLTRSQSRKNTLRAQGYASNEAAEQIEDELAYWQRVRVTTQAVTKQLDTWREDETGKRADQLGKMEDGLKVARSKLEGLIVRAPIDGQLTAMDAKLGETKPQGQRLGQISREGGYKLTAEFDEFYLGRVVAGQTAMMPIGGKPVKLTVAKIFPEVKSGRVTVDLSFAETPADLRPGQTLQGKLSLGSPEPAMIVPTGAFLEETGGASMFVVDADGSTATRRKVRLGRRSADSVEVLEGLQPGERVVTSDYSAFKDKERIEIR